MSLVIDEFWSKQLAEAAVRVRSLRKEWYATHKVNEPKKARDAREAFERAQLDLALLAEVALEGLG